MTTARIGDLVEIKTKLGLAYAHYSYKHKQYGALLRVFNRIHSSRPTDFISAVSGRPSFHCFFPLGAAVNRGIVSVVGNTKDVDEFGKLPMFRTGIVDPASGKVAAWWLWNGEQEWQVGKLTEEQRLLSIRGVWNDTLLIDRIESGWTPETDQA